MVPSAITPSIEMMNAQEKSSNKRAASDAPGDSKPRKSEFLLSYFVTPYAERREKKDQQSAVPSLTEQCLNKIPLVKKEETEKYENSPFL